MNKDEIRAPSSLVHNDHFPATCPACGLAGMRPLGNLAYGQDVTYAGRPVALDHVPRLISCDACESWFTANAVRPDDASKLYAQGLGDVHWRTETFERAKTPEVVNAVAELLRPGQSIVDIGCNTGELLDYCRLRGASTFGIELSERARSICVTNGHSMINALDELPTPVDLLFAFDLVEHLYDLRGFLRSAQAALRPGGRLIVLTGDNSSLAARAAASRWWYASYPEHVTFPSWRFWRSCKGFDRSARIRTYASPGYRTTWLRRWRPTLAAMTRRGNGLPSPGPDHHLLVLTKS